jgi:hypothetical protein
MADMNEGAAQGSMTGVSRVAFASILCVLLLLTSTAATWSAYQVVRWWLRESSWQAGGSALILSAGAVWLSTSTFFATRGLVEAWRGGRPKPK